MKREKKTFLGKISIILIVISFCMGIGWYCKSEIDYMIYYGSKEYALDLIDEVIQAAYASPEGSSLHESLPEQWFAEECWEILQEESKANGGTYQVLKVLDWYEHAESLGHKYIRDVDDIYVDITFDGIQIVHINVYEGGFAWCYMMDESGEWIGIGN